MAQKLCSGTDLAAPEGGKRAEQATAAFVGAVVFGPQAFQNETPHKIETICSVEHVVPF